MVVHPILGLQVNAVQCIGAIVFTNSVNRSKVSVDHENNFVSSFVINCDNPLGPPGAFRRID